jgi:hypothetical protein
MKAKDPVSAEKLIEGEIKKLKPLTDKEKIIESLQTIGKILVTSAMFKSKSYSVYPLLVEAYYYKEGVFMDDSVYLFQRREKQKEQYKPYGSYEYFIHGKAEFEGLDIVLFDYENHCLSYLLKCVLIQYKDRSKKSEILNQIEFFNKFAENKKEFQRGHSIVAEKAKDDSIRTKDFALVNIRKGLSKNCCYKDEYLAIVTDINKYINVEEHTKLTKSLYGRDNRKPEDDKFGGGVQGLLFRNIPYYQSLPHGEKA